MTPSTPSAFPFHAPCPRMADWGTELFQSENSALLMPGQHIRADHLDSLLPDPSVPILAFTGTLHHELRYLARTIPNSEWAVFLTLKRLSETHPQFLAFDWFMPVQRVNAAEVAMDVPDTLRYYEALNQVDYYRQNGLHQHLCHLHSHGSMQAFFSSTDDEQQYSRSELGFYGPFRFYVVVNAAGDIKVSLVTYEPVLFRSDAVAALVFSRPEYAQPLTATRKAEIDQMVRDALVKTPARQIRVVVPAAGKPGKKGRGAKDAKASDPSARNKAATMAEAMRDLLRYLAGMGPSMVEPGADERAETDPQGRPLWELRDALDDNPEFAGLVNEVRRLSESGPEEYDLAEFLADCLLAQEDEILRDVEDVGREAAGYLDSLAHVLFQASRGVPLSAQDKEKLTKDAFLSSATVRAARSTGTDPGYDDLYRCVRKDFDALLAGKKPHEDRRGPAFPLWPTELRRTA